MESNTSNTDNSTFGGSLNASTNSTPDNVPRDGRTIEDVVGSILSKIQQVKAAYERLGRSYCSLFSANPGSGERMPDVGNSSTQTIIPDGGILSLIQEQQIAFQELGHTFGAIFSADGERMTDVVNSSTQTPIPEREGDMEEDEDDGQNVPSEEREGGMEEDIDEDDGQDLNMEIMSYEALLEHHKHISVELRVRAFYLSIKLHKYKSPKSTCLESKEHCSICLDDYCNGQELAKIDCGHVYHIDCIKEWIKLKNSCPICKRNALAILT